MSPVPCPHADPSAILAAMQDPPAPDLASLLTAACEYFAELGNEPIASFLRACPGDLEHHEATAPGIKDTVVVVFRAPPGVLARIRGLKGGVSAFENQIARALQDLTKGEPYWIPGVSIRAALGGRAEGSPALTTTAGVIDGEFVEDEVRPSTDGSDDTEF